MPTAALILLGIMALCAFVGAGIGYCLGLMAVAQRRPKRFRFAFPAEKVAMIVHEANRAYSATLGDFSHKTWKNTPQHLRDGTIRGVVTLRANPGLTPEQMHHSWMRDKERQGYRYGPVKDHDKRTHPCMVPYHQLPVRERFKDHLFHAIVNLTARQLPGAARG